jgi:hypothetical protein
MIANRLNATFLAALNDRRSRQRLGIYAHQSPIFYLLTLKARGDGSIVRG